VQLRRPAENQSLNVTGTVCQANPHRNTDITKRKTATVLLGAAPRYGTARCASTIRDWLSGPRWKDSIAGMIPPDIAEQISWDLLGLITGLPAETERIPWDGPQVRIIEHQAHAPGHAALLIEERGVLVVGDLLSDALIPMLNLNAAGPIEDYLAALRLIEGAAG
jgi:glyoxylase-like metal-dependent hydrolase (beta-lactamase superfamily II)